VPAREAAGGREMDVLQEVACRFRSDFLNRIDEQVVFRTLEETDVQRIRQPILEEVPRSLQEKD
jgi:ATP-dependent Clp protease ATP-binding subunit ClpA